MDLGVPGLLFGASDKPFPIAEESSFDRVIEAIRIGREAVQMSLGELRGSDRLAMAWLECAEAWELLGDRQRGIQARRFSDGWALNRGEFLADRVRYWLEGSAAR
jgi:hypothetical protein